MSVTLARMLTDDGSTRRPALSIELTLATAIASYEWLSHRELAVAPVYLTATCLIGTVCLVSLLDRRLSARMAHALIDATIAGLLAVCLVFQGRDLPGAEPLIASLTFWTPLLAARWACHHFAEPTRLAGTLTAFGFVLLLVADGAGAATAAAGQLLLGVLVAVMVQANCLSIQRTASAGAMPRYDPLTGLASGERFEDELALLSAVADRYRMPLSLIGYRLPAGEIRQPAISELISGQLRNSDTACLWDQSTFLILLPNTDESEARLVAGKIEATLAEAGLPPVAQIALITHRQGEDPMSTLSELETELNAAAACPT